MGQQYLTYKCEVKRISYGPFVETMGFSATKVWNTAIYWSKRIWDETGVIPSEYDLRKIVKRNSKWYAFLPADVADAVIKEVAGSYKSWYKLRKNKTVENERPPSFRRKSIFSVLTFRDRLAKLVPEWGNVLKLTISRKVSDRSAFIYVEFATRPDADLSNIKLVKLKETQEGKYALYITIAVSMPEISGDNYAAIDLGINNVAVIAYSTGESQIFPASWALTQDYYFRKEIAKCQVGSSKYKRLNAKLSARKQQYFHALTKQIITECTTRGVKQLYIGDLTGIRKNKDYGDKVNSKLHGWNFAKITDQLTYKGAILGVDVTKLSERDTSKTCMLCGNVDKKSRVYRGLYKCRECGHCVNADVNGAFNILRKGIPEISKGIGRETRPEIWRWDAVRNVFAPYVSNQYN